MGNFHYSIIGPDETVYAEIRNAPVMPQAGDSIWAWDHRIGEREWIGTAKLKVAKIRFGVYKERPELPDIIWAEVLVERPGKQAGQTSNKE